MLFRSIQQNPVYYQTPHIQTPQQLILLSNTSRYYQTPILLSNKSFYYQSTHIIIKHLILLSTPQLIILTLHMILLLSRGAALVYRGATGRALA